VSKNKAASCGWRWPRWQDPLVAGRRGQRAARHGPDPGPERAGETLCGTSSPVDLYRWRGDAPTPVARRWGDQDSIHCAAQRNVAGTPRATGALVPGTAPLPPDGHAHKAGHVAVDRVL